MDHLLVTKSKRDEESDLEKASEYLKKLLQHVKYEDLTGF